MGAKLIQHKAGLTVIELLRYPVFSRVGNVLLILALKAIFAR